MIGYRGNPGTGQYFACTMFISGYASCKRPVATGHHRCGVGKVKDSKKNACNTGKDPVVAG
jgi:hypothetical protein